MLRVNLAVYRKRVLRKRRSVCQ